MYKDDQTYLISCFLFKLEEARRLGLGERGIAQFVCEELAAAGYSIERGPYNRRRGKRLSAQTRFFTSFTPEPNTGCWLWTGTLNAHGYAIHMGKPAHRWSYVAHGRQIRGRQHIDHLCGQPSCVNPQHLEAVSARENNRRKNEVRALARAHAYALAGGYAAAKYARKSGVAA